MASPQEQARALRIRAQALRSRIQAEQTAGTAVERADQLGAESEARARRAAELAAERAPTVANIERREARRAVQTAAPAEAAASPFRTLMGMPAPAADTGMSAGEVASGAWQNLVPSAKKFAQDIGAIVTDPAGTAEGLYKVGSGLVQMVAPGEQGNEKYAREVGKFFGDRYGGWESLKKTIATDPVGFMGDAATVLTGGGMALARAPQMGGRIGRIAKATGTAVDPAAAAARGVKALGKGAGKAAAAVLGTTTGAGPKAVATAARTGMVGGDLGQKFRAAMRGDVPMEEVVGEARGALQNMYERRSQAYQQNMAAVQGDPSVLDFGKLDRAMARVTEVKKFKGVPISRSTEDIRNTIAAAVNQWRGLNPLEYHTVEGFDALKQSLGDVLEGTKYGTPEWKVANEAYQAVKKTITDQAPGYAKAMKDYTRATELLNEIQGELSLGRGKNAATSLRKLQAIIRDDVSSAYGRRTELAKELEGAGARGLTETMAGQAMSALRPRGMGNITGSLGAGGLAFGAVNPGSVPPALALMLASSPRVVGEVAHAAGRAARPVDPLARAIMGAPPVALPAAYQAGRLGGYQ